MGSDGEGKAKLPTVITRGPWLDSKTHPANVRIMTSICAAIGSQIKFINNNENI